MEIKKIREQSITVDFSKPSASSQTISKGRLAVAGRFVEPKSTLSDARFASAHASSLEKTISGCPCGSCSSPRVIHVSHCRLIRVDRDSAPPGDWSARIPPAFPRRQNSRPAGAESGTMYSLSCTNRLPRRMTIGSPFLSTRSMSRPNFGLADVTVRKSINPLSVRNRTVSRVA